jgi:hypothetical protein
LKRGEEVLKAFDYEKDDAKVPPRTFRSNIHGKPQKIPPIFKFHLLNLIKSFMKNFEYEL